MVHQAISGRQFDACLPFFGTHIIADAFEIGVIFHRHLLRQWSILTPILRDSAFVQVSRKAMTIAEPLLIISGMHLAVRAVKRTNKYGPMSQAHLMSFELFPPRRSIDFDSCRAWQRVRLNASRPR